MDRREFLKSSAISLIALPAVGALAKAQTRPNILFVFSDQQRHDTVDCYGEPIFEGLTPNLDKMASQGVRFANAFTPQPVCGPARAALQTGKYANETGCFTNGIALKTGEKTMANWLGQVGYEVGYIGKWHLASDDACRDMPKENRQNYRTKPIPVERRGGYKDYWLASDILEFTSSGYGGHMFDGQGNKKGFSKEHYRVDAQTDCVLDYLDTRKGDRPFFLFVSYVEPHHQNNARHFIGPKGSKKRFADYNVPGDLKDTVGDWKEEMPDYLGCCNSLDENLGRIRAEIDKLGIADNTLLIYTSDHSCHFRTRNSEYKRSCHDNSIHIPMIVHGPGFKGGKVVNEMVSLIDLAPTILTAAGTKLPNHFRGKPLQQLAAGNTADWPEEVFVQISESHIGRAVRTKRWTYSLKAQKGKYVEDFLYDNQKDPYQKNNLISDLQYKAVRKELAHILSRKMTEANDK